MTKKPKTLGCLKVLALLLFMLTVGESYALLDLDDDGYSDIWERKYGVVDLNPFDDPDGDGEINIMEHQAGTDPYDPDSVLDRSGMLEFSDAQLLVGWQTDPGSIYELQDSDLKDSHGWSQRGEFIRGTGAFDWVRVGSTLDSLLLRTKVATPDSRLAVQYASLVDSDTDLDGISDWNEWKRGTDIFVQSPPMAQPVIERSNVLIIKWASQAGKSYQVESRVVGSQIGWKDDGPARLGTGGEMEVVIPIEDPETLTYALWAEDVDSDGDGLSDWEEGVLKTRLELGRTSDPGAGDLNEAIDLLAQPNRLKISAPVAIGNVTRGLDGLFEIRRVSGVDRLEVRLSASGDAIAGVDYEELPSTVILPFGIDSISLPVKVLPTAMVSVSEEVLLRIEENSRFDVEGSSVQAINLISEALINVRDYGAEGDGLSDDREAIQNAITALENDSSRNTLYFPEGLYNLASYRSDSKSTTSRDRILKLGATELWGRDLVIAFDENAVLYSTVSPVRAHILECLAKFRSLTFYNANFEKNSIPLGIPLKIEPNGADGVALVMHDLRDVEMVQFLDCRFYNCHGPVSTYGSGFDTRGKLGYLRLRNCSLLCPFGANSVNDSKIWGGGQMVNLSPWIGTAEYHDNYFDGGSQINVSPSRNPLDRKKDGGHFGSPLRLVFTENVVDHMRVEAVYQLHNPLMSFTEESIEFPPVGGEVSFRVRDLPSTYREGEKVAIRGPVHSMGTTSLSLTISGYLSGSRVLTVRNDGENPFPLEGISFSPLKVIYLQGNHAGEAVITDNVVRALNEEGRRSSAGIVANSRSLIRNNYVEGFTVGVQLYGDFRTPLTPGSLGTLIENNMIYTPNGSENPASTTYGIQSWGPSDVIRENLIFTPESRKVIGIALRGERSLVERNIVIAGETVRNGYSDSDRSVGIGVGNNSANVRIKGNTTRGFDVGVGPANPYQSIPHYVSDHRSVDDQLARDFRGAIEE